MEPLFKTTTIYTYDEFKKFNAAVMKKRGAWTIIIGLEILFLLCNLILQTVWMWIFIAVYPIIFIVMKNIEIKKVYNSNKFAQDIEVNIDFYDTYFTVKTENSDAKIEYDKLHTTIETKTNFYLMIAKNQGYMLSKENMSDEFQSFVRKIK